VLELSLREALQLDHSYIGTEHILLGLMREGDGVAAQVLVRSGVDLNTARQEVIRLLRGYTAARADDLRDRLASFAARLAVIEQRLKGVAPGSPAAN
jgi:ATP-dependent Clp protease ATP-binding subunit ClpA